MKIEKNGRLLCGEKSRHIHICYFFIKDVLKQENIELLHCPTERMIADYFTKPLQGKLFKYMRDIIMGLAPFPVEERVEVNVKESTRKVHQTEVADRTYADAVRGNSNESGRCKKHRTGMNN